MNYNNRSENDSTAAMRAVCAVAFIIFSFCFLYFRQADVLCLAQHVLSGGQTAYSPAAGAVLITLTLFLLHRIVNSYFKINRRFHWLTYLPPMLLLTIISDISPDIDKRFSFGSWLWVAPLVLIVWTISVSALKSIQNYEADINSRGVLSRLTWVNMFALCMMFMVAGFISAGNDVFHYRAKIETLMVEGRYSDASSVGIKSMHTDTSLTMLRCYALARESRMADQLFNYPLAGNSKTLLPLDQSSRMVLYPTDSLYRFLGARPSRGMDTPRYLKALLASGYHNKAISDYILCGMLVDRDIDAFVRELPKHYTVNDSLPVHYREALILYTHMRSNPLLIYKNQVMDTDFDDFKSFEDSIPDLKARMLAVHNHYFGTYWWYHDYGNKANGSH